MSLSLAADLPETALFLNLADSRRYPEEKRLDKLLGRVPQKLIKPGTAPARCVDASEQHSNRRDQALRGLGVRRSKKESPGLYARRAAADLPPETLKAIDDDLLFGGAQTQTHAGRLLGWAFPPIQRFHTKAGREPLHKVVRALVASDPIVGYRRELGLITAGILAIVDGEEEAFFAVQEVIRKFNIRGFFVPPYAELEASANVLWQMVAAELPDVAAAFSFDEEDGRPAFEQLVCSWLSTLFLASTGRQSFADFVLLLHAVVCSQDQLEPLHAVFAVLVRLQASFSSVRSRQSLIELCNRLRSELVVDTQLLWHIRGQGRAAQWRVTISHLCRCILPAGKDVREFSDFCGLCGWGPDCPFQLSPGHGIWQKHSLLWGGEYRIRLLFDALVWQAPNAAAIHRVPVVCGVYECAAPGTNGVSDSESAPMDIDTCYGFALTRTENRALWGITLLRGMRWELEEDEDPQPDFYVGGLSRKLQFDLKLRLAPHQSYLEFIYNNTALGRIEWSADKPVRFAVNAPCERSINSHAFLSRLSQKAVQRVELGASCKQTTIGWVHPSSTYPTYDVMLPRQFISDQRQPGFIYRAKDRSLRGFEFPGIGPGEEIEQEKGVIGAGAFELKVSLDGLQWSQANDVMCPIRSEGRLLQEHDGQDMALFVGMRFVEYFGVYIHKSPGGGDRYLGWLSTDSSNVFEVEGENGNLELTLMLWKSRRSSALISQAQLAVKHRGRLIASTQTSVSSLIPASFRVKNGILIRTVRSERHVYGSSCSVKFAWTKVERQDEE